MESGFIFRFVLEWPTAGDVFVVQFGKADGNDGGEGALGSADNFLLEGVEEFLGDVGLGDGLFAKGKVVEGGGYAGG